MRTAVRRRSTGRSRVARRLLTIVVLAVVSIGCIADTSTGAAPVGSADSRDGAEPEGAPMSGTAVTQATPTPVDDSSQRSPAPSPSAPPVDAKATVPILYYHRIEAVPTGYPAWSADRQRRFITYDVIPAAFAAQLDWLRQQGYTTILPRDLTAYWEHGTPLPDRPVIVSFDDGSRDWVDTVLPLLQARGMVAEFYLTLDAIEHHNLTWAEVRHLAAAGNGIGAHDVHHVQLTALGRGRASASPATMWSEVSEARRIIGLNIGAWPDSMAYVGGGFDAALEKIVQAAGYTSARGIQRGIVQGSNARYRMPVVRIGAHDDVTDLLGGVLVEGLPTFTARMLGVSDKTSD